jgi:hypothetical protein
MEYAAQGKFKDAVGEFEQTGALSLAGYAHGRGGQRTEALHVLDELREVASHRHVSPTQFALVHIGLGQKDEALRWLEKGYADRSDYMIYLGTEPMLDTLREDPRFQDLVRRVGVPVKE